MYTIIFLSTDNVLSIHEAHIKMFGGAPGIRDRHLLDSAVLAPQATFAGSYLHVDMFAMAAAYMHSIIKNHPFFDGNKRTGISTGLVFLRANDIPCYFSNEELVEFGINIANSTSSFEDIAEQLRHRCNQ